MWWIVKIIAVLFFLIMFLRRSNTVWGAGLLTLTTAFLLDAATTFFGQEAMIANLGNFSWVLGGALAAGAYIWLRGILQNQLPTGGVQGTTISSFRPMVDKKARPARRKNSQSAVDRGMLFNQIRDNLGPDDVLDLIFDLDFNENELVNPSQTMMQIANGVLDTAEDSGQLDTLSLGVERILTPVSAENLPRLTKLSPDSPPTILRQFLIANYNLADLAMISDALGIDWQEMGDGPKKTRVRHLLLYCKRRNRLRNLINYIQNQDKNIA